MDINHGDSRHVAARFRKPSDRSPPNTADRSAGPSGRFACFLIPLTFKLAEFFMVLYVRAKHCQLTYQLHSFLRREPVADDRNADLTFNRSAHHTCALDDTIPA